jgi:hypothetical protein
VRRGELTPLFRSVWYDLERRRSAPIEEFMRHRTNKSSSTVTKCIRVLMCSRQQEVRSFFDATIRARGDKGSWTWKNTVRGGKEIPTAGSSATNERAEPWRAIEGTLPPACHHYFLPAGYSLRLVVRLASFNPASPVLHSSRSRNGSFRFVFTSHSYLVLVTGLVSPVRMAVVLPPRLFLPRPFWAGQ